MGIIIYPKLTDKPIELPKGESIIPNGLGSDISNVTLLNNQRGHDS